MKKTVINPWEWQDSLGYVQAVEVSEVKSTLYISGQAAVHPDGSASNADMRTQFKLAIENLKTVIAQAGYTCSDIVRLTIYSTSSKEFMSTCIDLLKDFAKEHDMKQALSLYEVVGLNETMNVELEATAAK